MNGYLKAFAVVLVAGFAVALSLETDVSAKSEPVELDVAEVFIEWNSSDTDYGLQIFWDSEGFTRMKVLNHKRKAVLDVKTKKNVKAQGLTEGHFESVEPAADELSKEEFLARFPEGTYRFKGKGIEGEKLVAEAEFTHTLPAPPANLFPAESDTVSHLGFTAGFDAVTEDTDGNAIDIEFYTLVVEKTNDEPILQVFSVILPPSQTSVTVPAEFLEPSTEYKLEIIAQEESGNRTITEVGSFMTDGL